MSWFADLAGRAENLLNNLDEQTGVALRNHNTKKAKHEKYDYAMHPDGNWGQKRRPIPRNLKKIAPITETRSTSIPSRKPSPIHQLRSNASNSPEPRKAPRSKKKSPQYHLNHCPKTLVNDDLGENEIMDHFGLRHRRHSLPSDLELMNDDDWTIRMQNLEVENAMLKNELNVINREVSEMVDRLRIAEDGNVDRNKELGKNRINLNNSELQNYKLKLEKDSISLQLEPLKEKITELANIEQNYQDEKQRLNTEITLLKDANNELEERVKELTKNAEKSDLTHHKIETEMRHAQTTITDLQSNLDKSNAECHRLEKDWEMYKLRVKSMLFAKDNEIKGLQDGLNLTEDTKVLMEQLDNLKEERDELSDAISRVRSECDAMKQYLPQVEARHTAAERVVAALRDAMRDERAARNRAEAQCLAMNKELKSFQIETGQTIASLRTALRDKDSELNHLRDTASSVKTTDTSALNVADYDDVIRDTLENEKIQYLTETLVQRQGRVDKLLADNNMLRIQLDKLETKYKTEISHRANNSHSVVNVQTGEHRARRARSDSTLRAVSHRMAAVIRRHPVLRIFVVIYMICLHLWVVTVLLTSTPAENFAPRPSSAR